MEILEREQIVMLLIWSNWSSNVLNGSPSKTSHKDVAWATRHQNKPIKKLVSKELDFIAPCIIRLCNIAHVVWRVLFILFYIWGWFWDDFRRKISVLHFTRMDKMRKKKHRIQWNSFKRKERAPQRWRHEQSEKAEHSHST